MTKLLLIGRGQIGQALARDLIGFDLHVWPHDLDDLSTEALDVIGPDAIVNAAGKTNLSWCEENAREAMRSNLEAPVRLYTRILDHNRELGVGPGSPRHTRYIHFSSGCVWDGPYTDDGKPFTPDIPPSPACLYSWTKAAADAMLMDLDSTQLAILRPRQVYSSSPSTRNTLTKLMAYPRLVDTPNSVSSMSIIAKTLSHVVNASEDWSGIWNVYDPGVVTPFEIGEMLFQAGLRGEPQRIPKADLDKFHTPRRVDTVLYDERFEAAIQPHGVIIELNRAINELRDRIANELDAPVAVGASVS